MIENRKIRMSVARSPARRLRYERAVATLIEGSGFSVEIEDHGTTNPLFETLQESLVEGTTDYVLLPSGMLPQSLADGISLAAVFPRESARMCLLAAPGASSPTLTNPTGLNPGAAVGVLSLGQQSQLLALCPDLDIVKISQGEATGPALRNRILDAALIPAHEINNSDLEDLDLFELGEEIMLPPPGEGITVIVTRTSDPLGKKLKSLDDSDTRRCLAAEQMLADALGRPAGLADLATVEADGAIRLQATLAGDASDPRLALARVGVVAPTPEAAAELCRFALEECLGQTNDSF